MFVTMVAGVYDLREGSVRLANAGHEPPLYRDPRGRFESFPAQAPPLGILPGIPFPELDVELRGGSLYLCSDGLTEACGEGGEALGAEGLRRLVTRFAGEPLAERVEAIAADVGKLELRDDLTLLAVADDPARRA
jgi:sigma-B regulation protein RsbU (phosphoserine phosphatase)